MRRPALVLTALLAVGCARPAPVLVPEAETYAFPAAQPRELTGSEAHELERAWRELLAGKAGSAERRFAKLAQRRRGLVPAETGLAYARLAAGRLAEAERGFAAVLQRRSEYLPALAGAAAVALRQEDPDRALVFYRRAEAVAPSDPVVRRRLAQAKLQATELHVSAARAALQSGEREHAIDALRRAIAAAPEVAGLRLELSDLLVEQGDVAGAAALLAQDPSEDRQVRLQLGDALMKLGDHAHALEAYRKLLLRDPRDAEAARKALEARRALEFSQMPEEYQRIFSASRISRADLAALIAQKLPLLRRLTTGEAHVATDISGSWARDAILAVLAFDVMELYPNHTFQPGATVRRGDLARAVARILDLVHWPAAPAPALRDMSPNHFFYEAAQRTVAAGLMDLTSPGDFEPWRSVSGRDAAEVIEALARLAGP